jgi:hypothetical protein
MLLPGGLNMNARSLASLAAIGLAVGSNMCAAQTAAGTEERITRSSEGSAGDHAADELRDPGSFELLRREPGEVVVKPRSRDKGAQSVQSAGDSWIYDATTDTFADNDRDGYYRYLRVQLDADTIYDAVDVYAEIYISADGTAWELLYSTQDFTIWGTDDDDDYEVETELISGYSTGLYDVLVELYDSETGEFLDEYGPNESTEFSLLPLEDSGRDGLVIDPPAPPSSPPPVTVVHEDGGGGAVSWLALASLLSAFAMRRRRLAA